VSATATPPTSLRPARTAVGLIGAATLLSGGAAILAGDDALGVYWLVATPLVLLAAWRLAGLSRRTWLVLLAGCVPFAVTLAGGSTLAGDAAMGAALALLGFSWRREWLALTGAALLGAQIGVAVLGTASDVVLVVLVTGFVLLAGWLAGRGET